MFEPPKPTAVLGHDVHYIDTRPEFTLGQALGRRDGQLASAVQQLIDDTLKQHGNDPRDWPVESLDELARLDGRRQALQLMAGRAQRLHTEWRTSAARKDG